MQTWVLVLALIAAAAFWFVRWQRRRAELERASEERFSALMAEARAGGAPAPGVKEQRLLFEAAAKAAEAGEPALSIQLYARLLSRYPDGALATQARSALETQKKNLAKA